jgi:pilus assembly protein CpaB
MNRRTRTLLVVAIALVTASVASFAVYRAVQRIPVREVEMASVQIVVARGPLPIGTLVTAESAKLAAWPKSNQVPGAFASIEQVVNRGVILPIGENEPITDSKLAPVGAGAGLSPTIPSGMRAISVKVNEVIGVAGFVIPGSRVDVLVTVDERDAKTSITRAVVSNVEVLTSGTRFDQQKAQAEGKPIPSTVVTLLATPEDAERITLAATDGKIMLTLRNPLDTQPTETAGIRMASLTGPPAAPPVIKATTGGGRKRVVQPKPAAIVAAPEPTTVEAIRGGKRGNEVVKDDGVKKVVGSTEEKSTEDSKNEVVKK